MQIPRTNTTTPEATSTTYARKLQEFGFDSLTIDGQRSPFATQDWNHLGDMSRSSYNERRPDGPRPYPSTASSRRSSDCLRHMLRRRDGHLPSLPHQEHEET
jgi:hypothetical protein